VSFDSVKLGRNELCPCDSGKKYKKCCLINPQYEANEEIPQDRVATLVGKKRLAEKITNRGAILSPPVDSMPKISGCILELAQDLLEFTKNKSQRKKAITAACVAWNIAVSVDSEESLQNGLNDFLASTGQDQQDQDDFREILSSLIMKKNLLFPDDMRLVVDFEVVDTKSYFSVNVAAMLQA
jgi:hypothetical protein